MALAKVSNTIERSLTPTLSSAKNPPELVELDARLKFISQQVIQPSPYLLTIPTNNPCRLNPEQASDWRRGTPFGPDEEHLQYVSFLPNWDDSIIQPVGGWDNDKGEIAETPTFEMQRARSGTMTPGQNGVKKILTLAEYTNRRAGGHSGDESAKSNGVQSKQVVDSDVKVADGLVPSHEDKRQNNLKRSVDEMLKPEVQVPSEVSDNNPHVEKRPRIMPPHQDVPTTKPANVSTPESQLPPKLSMPVFLSPTLPPIIEVGLAKISNAASLGAGKSQPKAAPKRDIRKEETQISKSVAPQKGIGTDGKGSVRNVLPASSRISTPDPSGNSSDPLASVEQVPRKSNAGIAPNGSKKKSLIARLRIPRARRKDVGRILQMRPSGERASTPKPPKQVPGTKPARTTADPPLKSTSTRVPNPSTSSQEHSKTQSGGKGAATTPLTKSNEKRPRTEDDGDAAVSHHPSKRQKGLLLPTPPERSQRASSTEVPKSNKTGAAKEQQVLPSNKRGEPPLEVQQNRLSSLGKDLKTKATELFERYKSSQSQSQDGRLQQRAMVTRIESVLCYMLLHSISDGPVDVRKWKTLLPYVGQAQVETAEERVLHGLCLQLDAVCRTVILHAEMEQLAGLELPRGNSRAAAVSPRVWVNLEVVQLLRAGMVEGMKVLGRLWVDGAAELGVEDLRGEFPVTWGRKARVPLGKGVKEKGKGGAGELNGNGNGNGNDEFYLPLSGITGGVEAVRAAWSLIGEWAGSGKVGWVGKLF